MKPRWLGPYEVQKVLGLYQLFNPTTSTILKKLVNQCRLTLYHTVHSSEEVQKVSMVKDKEEEDRKEGERKNEEEEGRKEEKEENRKVVEEIRKEKRKIGRKRRRRKTGTLDITISVIL